MHVGNISNSRTVTLYTQWTAFYTDPQINHLLKDLNLPSVDILQMYGHRICKGHYSLQSNILKADLVATAWHTIAEIHLLEGCRDPKKLYSSHTPNQDASTILLPRPVPKERKIHPARPCYGRCGGGYPFMTLHTVFD